MGMKECEVCGNEFYYKNKSKKTCSNSCRQQAYRNRKNTEVDYDYSDKKIELQSFSNENEYQREFKNLNRNFLDLIINEMLTYYEGESIHISQISFLKDLIDTIEFHIETFKEPTEHFIYLRTFIHKMSFIASKYQDEYGFIIFNKKSVKKKLNRIKRFLSD